MWYLRNSCTLIWWPIEPKQDYFDVWIYNKSWRTGTRRTRIGHAYQLRRRNINHSSSWYTWSKEKEFYLKRYTRSSSRHQHNVTAKENICVHSKLIKAQKRKKKSWKPRLCFKPPFIFKKKRDMGTQITFWKLHSFWLVCFRRLLLDVVLFPVTRTSSCLRRLIRSYLYNVKQVAILILLISYSTTFRNIQGKGTLSVL